MWFISAGVSGAELECATLITPLEGSTDSPTAIIIRWTGQLEAIGYEVSIGTSPFENDIVEQKIYSDTFTEQLDLPPNTTIYLIIIPFSNTQFSVGCEQMTFTTAPDCEHFVNPITEISLCYINSDESIIAVVDFDSFQKLEKELIGEQSGLEITYFNSDDNIVDLTQVNLIADEVTYIIKAEVKDILNCVKKISFNLTLSKIPTVQVFDDIVANERYELPELIPGNSYYTDANGAGTQLQAGQLITNSQTIFVFAEGDFCANQSSFKVSIDADSPEEQQKRMDYPKFFSPNGDGINDLWRPLQLFTSNVKGLPILIYDRYGNLVYRLDIDGSGWDGCYNGTELPASDYWFVMGPVNNYFRGHFTLKR